MDEKMLENLLKTDFSNDSHDLRERLLADCLDSLASDEDGRVIDDDDLDMLAAAGMLEAVRRPE